MYLGILACHIMKEPSQNKKKGEENLLEAQGIL